jgi:HAMP domain-containing protein
MGKTISLIRRFATACVTILLLQNGAQAQGTVYKCVDEQGRVEFTDSSRKGCKALDLPGYAPPPPPRASAPIPAVRPMNPGAAAPTVTPASFPRVDTAQQRARDDDRREILNDELRIEQKKLAELRRDFNNGEPERQGNERNYAKYQERVASMRDEIGRTERNVEALQREISKIR